MRAVGQIAIALCSDDHDVFEPDAADAEIVKSRLDGDDMAGAQDRVNRRDARRLVNVQAETMAGAVKEALHAAVDFTGRKTARGEHIENVLMYFFTVDAVADLLVADFLAGLHGGIDLFDFIGSAAAHDRAAQVTEVAVMLRARKDIEDDRAVGFDRPAALVMRIDALIA